MKTVLVTFAARPEEARALLAAARALADEPPLWWELTDDSCAEGYLAPLAGRAQAQGAEALLFPAGKAGLSAAAQLAARLDLPILTELTALTKDRAARAAYNANLTAWFALPARFVATVTVSAFAPAGGELPAAEAVEPQNEPWNELVERLPPAEDPLALSGAERVVACGKGAALKKNLPVYAELAQLLGAELGGTRPTAIDGDLPHSRLIGISGTLLHPKLCLALGASGAQAFAAGVQKSKLLIGVNNDPTAPLFRLCHAGVVADAAEFARALCDLLREQGNG